MSTRQASLAKNVLGVGMRMDLLARLRDVIVDLLVQQHGRFIDPAARHVADSVSTATQDLSEGSASRPRSVTWHIRRNDTTREHARRAKAMTHQSRNAEAFHELHTFRVPVEREVKAATRDRAQPVARQRVGAALQHNGPRSEHVHHFLDDGLEDLFVVQVVHTILDGEIHGSILATVDADVGNISGAGEKVAVFVERHRHDLCDGEKNRNENNKNNKNNGRSNVSVADATTTATATRAQKSEHANKKKKREASRKESNSHPVDAVESLFHSVAVVDVDVDVQHAWVLLEQLQDGEHDVVDLSRAPTKQEPVIK